jgi:hypothetical protein
MEFDDFVDEWQRFKYSFVHDLSYKIAQDTDVALRTCLNSYLGRADWTVDELRGRCFCVIPADKSSETCYIDNTALVIFYPTSFVIENNTARLTRQYKVLIGLEKEDVEQSR